jgi:HemY protein
MRTIIFTILAAALTVAAAWWIGHLVGAMTLQIGSYTVQAPVSVIVVALLLFALVIYIVFRLIHAVFGMGQAMRHAGGRSARRKGEQEITNTLVALAAREGDEARRHAQRAIKFLGETSHTLLLAAYAGINAGKQQEATEAFEKLAARKDSAFLGLRGLLTQAMEAGDWSRANDLAKQAEAAHPGVGWVRAERTHLAVRTGDWHEALLLNRDQAPHAALAAAAANVEEDRGKALKLARDAFKRDPALTAAALAYANCLREANREKMAQDVLRQAWAKNPHPELATAALAPAPDRMAKLHTGEALVKDAPDNAESHLLLARLSLEAGNIADAEKHAIAAERAGMTRRELYVLQADIAEAAGTDEAHQARYREAMRRASTADPDPAWVCENCGVTHATWHPACPNCHAAGRIKWSTPLKAPVALVEGPG